MVSHLLLRSLLSKSCNGYNVYLQTAVVAILVFVECPKSIASEVLVILRSYQNVKSIWQAVFKISRSQAISCIGYNVNLQTAVVAILVFVECPKSIVSEVLVILRSYQNVKSIWQAVFKISRSQAISCIGYNVNLQTAVVAILVFVECPKSIASEVLVILRPYQNVKSIWQAVFKISRSQEISCIGYNANLQTAVAAILVFVECPKSIVSEVLVVLRSYQNVKSIWQAVFRLSRSQAIVNGWTDGRTDGQGHTIIRPVFRRAYKKPYNTKWWYLLFKDVWFYTNDTMKTILQQWSICFTFCWIYIRLGSESDVSLCPLL